MVFAADYRTAVSVIVKLHLYQGVRADYAAEYGFESIIAGVDYFSSTTTINLPWIKYTLGVAGFAAATAYYSYFAKVMTPGGQPRYPCYDALALDLVSRCRGVAYLRLSARTWRIPYGLPCQSIRWESCMKRSAPTMASAWPANQPGDCVRESVPPWLDGLFTSAIC
jgi:hypothetical protein